MPKGVHVTADTVRAVRNAKFRWPDMTNAEIGQFVGASAATVGRVLNGDYDKLAQSVPTDGGASAELIASIGAKLDSLPDMDDKIGDMRDAVANLADIVHVIALVIVDGLIGKSEAAQWKKIIDAADPQFSSSIKREIEEVAAE